MVHLSESPLNLPLSLLSKCQFKPSPVAFRPFFLVSSAASHLLDNIPFEGQLNRGQWEQQTNRWHFWPPREQKKLQDVLLNGCAVSGPDESQWANSSRCHDIPNQGWMWMLHSGLQAACTLCLSNSSSILLDLHFQMRCLPERHHIQFLSPSFGQFRHCWCPWRRSDLTLGMGQFAAIPGHFCECWFLIGLFGKFWMLRRLQWWFFFLEHPFYIKISLKNIFITLLLQFELLFDMSVCRNAKTILPFFVTLKSGWKARNQVATCKHDQAFFALSLFQTEKQLRPLHEGTNLNLKTPTSRCVKSPLFFVHSTMASNYSTAFISSSTLRVEAEQMLPILFSIYHRLKFNLSWCAQCFLLQYAYILALWFACCATFMLPGGGRSRG